VREAFDADGSDLVMAMIRGTEMLADIAARPWRAARHARTLARLHDQLHEIAAPPTRCSLLSAWLLVWCEACSSAGSRPW